MFGGLLPCSDLITFIMIWYPYCMQIQTNNQLLTLQIYVGSLTWTEQMQSFLTKLRIASPSSSSELDCRKPIRPFEFCSLKPWIWSQYPKLRNHAYLEHGIEWHEKREPTIPTFSCINNSFRQKFTQPFI